MAFVSSLIPHPSSITNMATQVVMPKLSPTMEEGQISRWLKNEGDTVEVGEGLAEIDTDKATMEATALADGVLRKIIVQAGESVPLGDTIAIIGEADEDISTMLGEASSSSKTGESEEAKAKPADAASINGDKRADAQATNEAKETASVDVEKDEAKQVDASKAESTDAAAQASSNGEQAQSTNRLIVSPLAARMAAEAGVNLNTLKGSGPGGRIVKRDIEDAMKDAPQTAQVEQASSPAQTQQVAASQQAAAQSAVQSPVQGASSYRDVPNTEMRRTIARRLTSSIGPVPHFFLTTEIEMERVIELRKQLNELDAELKISLNDMIIKVVAAALMQHLNVNASFQDQHTRFYNQADIGVAVALEDGLITPVIRAANTKTISAIAREIRELAERARNRKLKPEEYTGATFSVSNLGKFGVDEFTAVINPPEAAILAVGAAANQAVVRDGEIVIRNMMRVTMSCDHRVIDGATGAAFLQTFKQIMENPLRLLA